MPGHDVWNEVDTDGIRQGAALVGFMAQSPVTTINGWLPLELVEFNVVRLSQSFIEAWRKCPSSAVAEKRATYGEAAAKGIVAHSIMDGRVSHQGIFPEVDEAFYDQKFHDLAEAGMEIADPDAFRAEVMAISDVLTEVYMEKYHPYVLSGAATLETEAHGTLVWDVREDASTDVDYVVITGSADLVITNGPQRIGVDYKSGSKMPEPWMVQRYGVQWRVYACMFELDEMYFEYPLAKSPLNGNKGDWVANRYNGVVACFANQHEREAYRRQLIAECLPIATALLRSQAPEDHVIRPTDWHCGKWCQRFVNYECIGGDVDLAWVAKAHADIAIKPAISKPKKISTPTEGNQQ